MARERSYRILVKDLVLLCSVGAYPEERLHRQRVRFNIDLQALWPSGALDDNLDKVVNYKDITTGIRKLVEEGPINLVETLSERIADMCLADPRVLNARVSVEKLDVEPLPRAWRGNRATALGLARRRPFTSSTPGAGDPPRRSGSGDHKPEPKRAGRRERGRPCTWERLQPRPARSSSPVVKLGAASPIRLPATMAEAIAGWRPPHRGSRRRSIR